MSSLGEARTAEGGRPGKQLPRPDMQQFWPYQSFTFRKLPFSDDQDMDLDTLIKPYILCDKCQPIRAWVESLAFKSISRDRDQTSPIFRHYSSREKLKTSMKSCHLCTLIIGNTTARREKLEYGTPWKDFEVSVTLVNQKERISKGEKSFIYVRGRDEGKLKEMIKLQLSYHFNVAVGSQPDSASCALSTASIATQELARSWLNECTSSHEKCNAIQQGFRPTRLLDLDTEDDASIKLVITASLDTCPNYTTLSYCWGGKGDFKLLQSNLQQFLKSISISELPKTIQDAIKVTRSLNFRYLWVDSLCIIQDSLEDWSRESITMKDVYGNCILNIAAQGAKDCEEGIFSHRDPLVSKPCRLFEDPERGELFVYPDDWNKNVHYDPWSDSPLNKRGWVIQELLLPSRTLYFGWGIMWNCREKALYEYKQLPESQHSEAEMKRLFWELILESPTTQLNVRDTYRLLALWWVIVTAYSSAKLTVPTDKGVAFSGIIESFKKRTGWKYLAGLWEPFLFDELLWVRTPEAGYEYYVHTSQPTWSWLRVDQVAKHWYYKNPHSITILASAKVADERKEPAVLKISFRLKIDFQEGIFDDDSNAQRGYVEHLGKVHRYIYYPDMQYDAASNLEWILFRYYDDDGPGYPDDSKFSWNKYDGLVVVPVPGMEGTYKRVGFAYTWIKKDDPTSFSFPPIENEASASHDSVVGANSNLVSNSVKDYFTSRYLSSETTGSWESVFLI
ncbi:heterokaryon incompatibility protein-domain-containing protein [Xylogone sp. PMI_703]|nr:heterokaryon incompatibility protein-domain-containing protein [Xylogone sp. PMI_703]